MEECGVDGCTRKVHAKGYCWKHYDKFRKYGDATKEVIKRYHGSNCSVDGCEDKASRNGLCDKHRQRVKKYGTAELPYIEPKICSHEGCTHSHYSRGFCVKHYQDFMFHNNPVYRAKTLKRVWRRRSLIRETTSEEFTVDEILDKTGGLCSLCFEEINTTLGSNDEMSLNIDHIQPLSKGGSNMKYNLLASHKICNIRKGNKWND